jgi:hypothetical protein
VAILQLEGKAGIPIFVGANLRVRPNKSGQTPRSAPTEKQSRFVCKEIVPIMKGKPNVSRYPESDQRKNGLFRIY